MRQVQDIAYEISTLWSRERTKGNYQLDAKSYLMAWRGDNARRIKHELRELLKK